MEVGAQAGMMFKGFVGLADKPNALVEIVLYLSVPNGPLSRMADVCSLINVSLIMPFSVAHSPQPTFRSQSETQYLYGEFGFYSINTLS